ncbi:Ni/Co efflux regulator RcnB [Variovorax sp. SG517]|uniref:RcnB family protein n=1 Tax=Variovorax sp. SG517 TaxID=2587117 RepID=UPI00159E08A6|nr:RcnB family protein [Variovorax sp. SG517]NVM89439.1 Ni/Co efflux regulator RcnB [Variovorax sp. SG517]
MNTNSKKIMAVGAAALAMCMAAGSAFAQDRRFDDNGRHGDGRYEQRDRNFDRRGPHGDRYYRGNQDFRDGRQVDRRGFPQPHAEWRRGGRVPPEYRGRNYVVQDWRAYRLQQPPRGYQWVGVGGDFVLAAIATGVIANIIAGQ